jgi:hypothetical protein
MSDIPQQHFWSASSLSTVRQPSDSNRTPEKKLSVPDYKSVIVGVAIKVSGSNISKLAIRVGVLGGDPAPRLAFLGAQSGLSGWITSDGNGFNANDYELSGTVPEGDILVGMGFRVKDNNAKTLALYSRNYNGSNQAAPLNTTVNTTWFPDDKNQDLEQVLSLSNSAQVIVGLGLSCSDSNASLIEVQASPLVFGNLPPFPSPSGSPTAHGCIQLMNRENPYPENPYYQFFRIPVGGTCPQDNGTSLDPSDLMDLGSNPNIDYLSYKLKQPGTLAYLPFPLGYPSMGGGTQVRAWSFELDP